MTEDRGEIPEDRRGSTSTSPWIRRKPPSPIPHLIGMVQAFLTSQSHFETFAKSGAIVGIIVVIGGAAMAARLHWASALYSNGVVARGLPVEGGLSAIPRLAMIVTGTLDVIGIIVVFLGLLYVATRTSWITILIIVALLLAVPWSWPGVFWPASVLIIGLFWRTLMSQSHDISTAGFVGVTAVTFLAALFIVVGRYGDPPTHFAMANVWTVNSDIPNRPESCPQLPRHKSATLRCVDGFYLGSDDHSVYLGRLMPAEIIVVPLDTVKEIRLLSRREPSSRPVPPRSLLSQRTPWDFSITPYTGWWNSSRLWGGWQD